MPLNQSFFYDWILETRAGIKLSTFKETYFRLFLIQHIPVNFYTPQQVREVETSFTADQASSYRISADSFAKF